MKRVISILLCAVLISTAFCVHLSALEFDEPEVVYDDDTSASISYIEQESASLLSSNRHSINCQVEPGKKRRGTNNYNLKVGDYITLDFTYTPVTQGETVKIGMYNSDTGQFFNYEISTGEMSKKFSISAAGTYHFEVWNQTSQTISVSGEYDIFTFSNTLNVPRYAQEQSNWCWATCVQMCADYLGNYGHSQSEIVMAAKGEVINEGGKGKDEYIKAIEYATNGDYTAEYKSIVQADYRLSLSQMKEILSTNIPLIIGYSNRSVYPIPDGHAVVVIAIDDENYYIRANDSSHGGRTNYYLYSKLTSATDKSQYYDTTIKIKKN